jgi:hypothetical protein
MTKTGRGVLLHDTVEPKISGYLIIGNSHYEIVGQRINDIRTNLHIRKTGETQRQGDLFDEKPGAAGDGQRDLV